MLRLAAVGAAAGLFSALFGVGGGIVVVPLLVLLAGYDVRAATATSLAAIVIVAAWGVAAHGALGNVDWLRAALVGVPALGGLLAGLALKARLSGRALERAFALLLLAVAVVLVVT